MLSLDAGSATAAAYTYGPVGGSGRGAAPAAAAETGESADGFAFFSAAALGGGGSTSGSLGVPGGGAAADAQRKRGLAPAAAGATRGAAGGSSAIPMKEQFFANPYTPPRGIVADARPSAAAASLPVLPSADAAAAGPQQMLRRWFAGARHPTACFFHLLFKFAVLAVYFLSGWLLLLFDQSEVFVFVFALVLLAVDFWIVKNVSGRILVGMRWWSAVDADGTSRWHFEHAQDGREINAIDWRVFWFTNYAWAATWLLLAVMALVQLQIFWLLLCLTGTALSLTNVVAYRKCSAARGEDSGDASAWGGGFSQLMGRKGQGTFEGLRNWAAAHAGAAAMQNLLDRVTGRNR